MNILGLHTIQAPQLGDVNFGQNMADQFNNINDNFLKIASAEFLKGDSGADISIVSYDLQSNESISKEVELILRAGHTNENELKEVNGYKWEDGIVGTIYLVYSDKLGPIQRVNWKDNLIGSLPYTYLDPRFNTTLILDDNGDNYKDAYDLSCILNWSNGEFQKLDAWPTLYFDEDKFQFCWRIHGEKSGLVAQGPQGRDGKSGNMLVVRTSNIEASSGGEVLRNLYIITHYLPDLTNFENPDVEWVEFDKTTVSKLGYDPTGCTAIVFQYDEEGNSINDRYWIATISGRFIDNEDKYVVSLSDYNKITTELSKDLLYSTLATLIGESWGGLYLPIKSQYNDDQGKPIQPGHMGIALNNGSNEIYNELHLCPVNNVNSPDILTNITYQLNILDDQTETVFTLESVNYTDTYQYTWKSGQQTIITNSLIPQSIDDINWEGHNIIRYSINCIDNIDNSIYPFIIHYPTCFSNAIHVKEIYGCSLSANDIRDAITDALK